MVTPSTGASGAGSNLKVGAQNAGAKRRPKNFDVPSAF